LTPFDTSAYNSGMQKNNNIMDEEIKPNSVYTTEETQKLLKISNSTIKRLLKKGLIKANKVGGQYRILGKEILRLISPEVEKKAIKSYLGLKKKIVEKINKW
jgi:excisionase family DNA binding protein